VNFHRARINVRLQSVIRISEFGKFESHDFLLEK
jgi:hypothetical protein